MPTGSAVHGGNPTVSLPPTPRLSVTVSLYEAPMSIVTGNVAGWLPKFRTTARGTIVVPESMLPTGATIVTGPTSKNGSES